jgi:hypothetical protein
MTPLLTRLTTISISPLPLVIPSMTVLSKENITATAHPRKMSVKALQIQF